MTDLTQQDSKQYGRPDDLKIIPFMKIAKPAAIFSILITLASVFFIVTKGLNLGLDFTGGISAELNYKEAVQPAQVAQALDKAGFKDAVVQTLGSNKDLIVRMPVQEDLKVEDLNDTITKAVQLPNNQAEVHKVDSVGGQVGNELYIRSAGALALALILMLIYVTIRFEFKLAMGAVISLFHDIVIIIGTFALFQWQFDLTVLAAILAVMGFSLNDNIVVSDRIRENFRKIRGATPREIVDIALTETLRRTIHTSMTYYLWFLP
jgi:preprotein translocase subunit SecF